MKECARLGTCGHMIFERREEEIGMKKDNIFWGIIFLLAAVALVLGKLGMLGGISVFSLVATVFLGLIIIRSLPTLHFAGILFPIAGLCILYDDQLGISALTPWTVLAVAALGSVGLSMIFGDRARRRCERNHVNFHDGQTGAGEFRRHGHDGAPDFQVIDEEDDSYIFHRTTFGASTKYINTLHLKEINLDCSFGAMKVYFDKAGLDNGQAVLWLQANFSGIELYIPREWRVENHINAILGGVDEKSPHYPQENGNLLVLKGNISFAGVDIIYI